MLVNFVNLTSVKEKFQVLYISVMQENDNNSDNIYELNVTVMVDYGQLNDIKSINFALEGLMSTPEFRDMVSIAVATCIYNRLDLQKTWFWARIICVYRGGQTRIICNQPANIGVDPH